MFHERRVPAWLLIAAALGLGACDVSPAFDPAAQSTETDERAIRDVMVRTELMNNNGDVDGWVALFEDGAVYMPPGQEAVTSREGLRDIATAGFTSWRSRIEIVPDEVVVLGDWAFARTRVTGSVTPVAGGEASPVDVKQVVIYRRQADGTWRIARLISNTNLS